MYTIGDLVAYDGLVFRVTAVSEEETPTYTLEPIRRKETTLTKTVSYPRKIMTLVIGEGTPLTSVSADDMTPLGAVTAQAMAIKDGYVRVKFVTGEGTAIDSQVIAEDAKVVVPDNPTREGHTFEGWYSDAECTSALDLTSATFGEDSSVYAKWTINTFTVTFNSNGGSDVLPQTIDWGDVAEEPIAPTKESYLFDAWYSDSDLSEEFDFETPITENIILYAGWDDAVIITFVSNGGTDVNAQTILVGASATEPTPPTRDEFVFDGWYYDNGTFGNAVNFETDVFSDDDTLYAKWTPAG